MTLKEARQVARLLLEEQEELGEDGNASLDQEALDALTTLSSKLLWERGNLYKGYPYGVEIEGLFGSTEIHGPFSSENEAWNYGMGLANESDGTQSFTLVKLETPAVKRIATAAEIRRHREEADADGR